MQTFMPHPDFTESAKCLDYKRLGKQRVECKQILNALMGNTSGWYAHPAVQMWRRYEGTLCNYAILICHEWRQRGYKDNLLLEFADRRSLFDLVQFRLPPWVGNTDFHRSHQSNLIRKLPEHYGPQFPGVPPDLPYIWPGRDHNAIY